MVFKQCGFDSQAGSESHCAYGLLPVRFTAVEYAVQHEQHGNTAHVAVLAKNFPGVLHLFRIQLQFLFHAVDNGAPARMNRPGMSDP